MTGTPAEDESKALQQWFRANGFRVHLEIGSINVSTDSQNPDQRPNHDEKYASVDRIGPGTEPQFFRKYKMPASDTTVDSFRRVKALLESEESQAAEETRQAVSAHVIPKLQSCQCPVCKSIDWRIAEPIFELHGFFGRMGTGQVVPVVLATCHICGHILPFNAIHVGAVKLTSEQKP